jgi:bifunctional UDP-N-acetylglucosamine pyrophosphorylase/glucosamine-1-phosphate N-acetyltransferase
VGIGQVCGKFPRLQILIPARDKIEFAPTDNDVYSVQQVSGAASCRRRGMAHQQAALEQRMGDAAKIPAVVQRLMERGVRIPCPHSVEVDENVNPERIAPGVVVHTGCRIAGATTSIGPDSEIGREAPAAIEDCQLGHHVELRGGFFSGATFLDGVIIGSAAHVRSATLLEEEASAAHAVGLKQTIFLPFVTAGSLINFCDALMAGGTSRRNHSEIGSSYIHFNFTPHQDKATPSLIGDVPHGVFLDRSPIFLGGQGGLVGPVRIAYGTVISAGTICRKDILEEGEIFAPPTGATESRKFTPGIYRAINRTVENNLIYIGNLWALRAWYQYVRVRTMSADVFAEACRAGALERIEGSLNERRKRLKELADKMPLSLERARAETGDDLPPALRTQQRALSERWQEIDEKLAAGPSSEVGAAGCEAFLKEWGKVQTDSGHIKAIETLGPLARKQGAAWLQAIVDAAAAIWVRP